MEPVARNDLKRYMDVSEVSTYLGLSKWMIYKLVDSRSIPFIPFGRVIRFDRVAVDRWAEKRSVPAGAAPRRRQELMEQKEDLKRIERDPPEGRPELGGPAFAPAS